MFHDPGQIVDGELVEAGKVVDGRAAALGGGVWYRRSGTGALAVLLLGLLATLFAVRVASGHVDQEEEDAFASDAQDAWVSVEQRLAIYEEVLRGLRAFFASTDRVDRDEFAAYVETEDIVGRLSGIQALEFTRRVPAEDLAAFEESVRSDRSTSSDGFPDFAVYPVVEVPDHFVVDYVEPMEGNEDAHGFDLASSEARMQAVETARDTGTSIATAPVHLVQETNEQAGFLVLLPVYDNGMPQSTVGERRLALRGFVNSVFRADDMLQDVLSMDREIEIEVYDVGLSSGVVVDPRSPDGLLYDSDPSSNESGDLPAGRSATLELDVSGRRWMLLVTDTGAARSGALLPWMVALSGLALSVALAGALFSLARGREQALRMAERLAHEASHDYLTGLANRALIVDRLDRALSRAARQGGLVGVMFLDLDQFKAVNDTHGHEAGDLVLARTADAIRLSVRASDTVGRLAGDEFVVVAEDLAGVERGRQLAERVRVAVDRVSIGEDRPAGITVSIGVVFSIDGDSDAASLLNRADGAMYRAKRVGGDRIEVVANAT